MRYNTTPAFAWTNAKCCGRGKPTRSTRSRRFAAERAIRFRSCSFWGAISGTISPPWREITDFAHIAVAAREGVETALDEAVRRWAAERTVEPRRLSEKGAGYVTFFSMPPHRTSATAVRRTLATQPLVEALKRLERDLPPAVVQYVLENGLYRPISYRQKQT